MAQQQVFNFTGLATAPNEVGVSPPGSFRQAVNVDSSKPGLVKPRRGFDRLNAFSDVSYRATSIFDYQSYIYTYHNSTFYNYVAGSWTSRGAVSEPSNALVPRHAFMNNNLYVATSSGLYKTDAYGTSLSAAGLPAGIATVLTQSSATGTAVDTSKVVNYRWILTKRDANNNLIQGPVCSGTSYTNSSGATKDVCVLGYLPSSLLGTETIQVYRSQGLAAVSDELQLVYQYPVNSSNVAASAKTFGTSDVNTGTDTITSTAHGFQDGTVVQFTTSGGLPAGISASTNYVVTSAATNTFKLKTLAGVAVDITTTGTGTHTATSQVAFAIFDVCPDGLLGSTLYTSPSQSGISQSNTQPPLATDIATYKEFLFYADTQSKQSFTFNLIAVNGGSVTTGLASSDTITIGSETYTAGATASYGSGSGTFVIDTATASASTRIDNTSRSLVDVINRSSLLYTATLVYTDSTSLPGTIRLEGKTLATSSFGVASSKQAAFSPQLPSTATSSTTSTADTFRNGLMYSRQGQPEAVPAVNIFRVGTASDPIVRILALRDALLIFKRKDGTFVLRGDTPSSFSVQPLDSTAKIVASESLVVLNNLIYGLFEAGICSCSDTSVQILSEAVSDKIDTLYGQCLDQVIAYTFGIAYEAENKYILALPLTEDDTSATYQLIYNANSGSFDEWDLEVGCGYISSEDQKLYVGSGSSAYVLQERKAYDDTDFCDYLGFKTISSVDVTGLILTISSGIDDFNIGDLLEQGTDEIGAYVTDVDYINSTVTVDYARSWNTGVADVDHYSGIPVTLEFNPLFGDNPAGLKHFAAATFHYKQGQLGTTTYTFSSDTTPSASEVEVEDDSSGAWGVGSWGEFPWGGDSVPAPTRVGVPRDTARCNALSVQIYNRTAQNGWELEGISLEFNPMSTRVSR